MIYKNTFIIKLQHYIKITINIINMTPQQGAPIRILKLADIGKEILNNCHSIQDTTCKLTEHQEIMNEETYIVVSRNTQNIFNLYTAMEYCLDTSIKRLRQNNETINQLKKEIETQKEVIMESRSINEKLKQDNENLKLDNEIVENDLCIALMLKYNSIKKRKR